MTMRRNIIALSLFEAAKFLHEQEIPAAAGSAPTPTDPETGEPIDLDAIIERLNIIRSGKSFSDPEVYGKLTTLYKSMSSEDKIKFNQQLRNIGAIVQNQTPVDLGAEAATPPAPETPAPSPEAAPATPATPPPASATPPPPV